MHVDLLTLYLLAIGTLLASSGMTLWEHRTHPRRSKELRILAAGYVTLAAGCVGAIVRHDLPGISGWALSNLVILAGYLLILHGVASLCGRQYRAVSIALFLLQALAWAVAGTRWPDAVWSYVCAFPIAVASAMTTRELLRNGELKSLRSLHIAAMVTGIHAVLYIGRAFVLPWLASVYGQNMLAIAGEITIYEGVLYSVVLPMTLLSLLREETHNQLLRESQTDYLTRLGNRRWFFEEGGRVISEGDTWRPISLLAFDLDRFKTINDQYGHKTGDEVLKSFAEIARSVMGPEAILARIGGEEFAALLSRHDTLRAREVGETVARLFAGTTSLKVSGLGIRATVSIGLAQFEDEASTLVDLLAAADQALYRAKSLGGNRLEVAQRDADPANEPIVGQQRTDIRERS
jgi:diguanylate cyclase (GGDEF)-like protein